MNECTKKSCIRTKKHESCLQVESYDHSFVHDFIVGKYVDEIWLEKKVKTHEHVFIDTSHLNKESKVLWYKCLITIGKDIHD